MSTPLCLKEAPSSKWNPSSHVFPQYWHLCLLRKPFFTNSFPKSWKGVWWVSRWVTQKSTFFQQSSHLRPRLAHLRKTKILLMKWVLMVLSALVKTTCRVPRLWLVLKMTLKSKKVREAATSLSSFWATSSPNRKFLTITSPSAKRPRLKCKKAWNHLGISRQVHFQ